MSLVRKILLILLPFLIYSSNIAAYSDTYPWKISQSYPYFWTFGGAPNHRVTKLDIYVSPKIVDGNGVEHDADTVTLKCEGYEYIIKPNSHQTCRLHRWSLAFLSISSQNFVYGSSGTYEISFSRG